MNWLVSGIEDYCYYRLYDENWLEFVANNILLIVSL